MTNFIERELYRIQDALGETRGTPKYDELYAALTALSWALDPQFIKSPYDMIMSREEVSKDCSDESHPLPS